MIYCSIDTLRASIYHRLKSLLVDGDSLEPDTIEKLLCNSFNFKSTGGSGDYADGVNFDKQVSIKTRKMIPKVFKKLANRDFHTHLYEFAGPNYNGSKNSWTAGVEVVQRRQALDLPNDSEARADIVGMSTLVGFKNNIIASHKKFGTEKTYEIIALHGYSGCGKNYLMSLFWDEYVFLNAEELSWHREKNSVIGCKTIDGKLMKVCERINGNAPREATCFKEYKDVTKYKNKLELIVPIPDKWEFDLEKTMIEMQKKLDEREHELFLFK